MRKSCMNCMRMKPIYDGRRRTGQRCMPNDFPVNRRMVCDEWKSNDILKIIDSKRQE